MAYTDIYTAATDAASTLRQKVAVAIHTAAVAIINEDPGTQNHAQRLRWARQVVDTPSGPVVQAAAHIWEVLENAVIAADPAAATDSDVQFTVNSLIDRFAGA